MLRQSLGGRVPTVRESHQKQRPRDYGNLSNCNLTHLLGQVVSISAWEEGEAALEGLVASLLLVAQSWLLPLVLALADSSLAAHIGAPVSDWGVASAAHIGAPVSEVGVASVTAAAHIGAPVSDWGVASVTAESAGAVSPPVPSPDVSAAESLVPPGGSPGDPCLDNLDRPPSAVALGFGRPSR